MTTAPPPDWAAALRGLADGAARLLAGAAEPSSGAADAATECRHCPVCTALAVLRGRRPDLSEALADLLATAAGALREQAAGAGTGPDPTTTTATPAEETVPPTPPPAPVQHIEVA